MEKTPTDQRSQECGHYASIARCDLRYESNPDNPYPDKVCALFMGDKHCPDFTPKTEKDGK